MTNNIIMNYCDKILCFFHKKFKNKIFPITNSSENNLTYYDDYNNENDDNDVIKYCKDYELLKSNIEKNRINENNNDNNNDNNNNDNKNNNNNNNNNNDNIKNFNNNHIFNGSIMINNDVTLLTNDSNNQNLITNDSNNQNLITNDSYHEHSSKSFFIIDSKSVSIMQDDIDKSNILVINNFDDSDSLNSFYNK